VIPRYAGTRYEWRIGETTDDTEQTLAVARALLRAGRADHTAIGEKLLRCRKSLHPGVALWSFVEAGDASRVAVDGDGCGAAMRAAPIGIFYPSSELDELMAAAYECALPTHGGPLGIGAAAAVAAAVSAAVEGRSQDDVWTVALHASGALRPYLAGIYSDLSGRPHLDADEIAARHFPDSPYTIVPLAISLALTMQSAHEVTLLAANIGGDADSVASIGGAIAGALRPETVNAEWFGVVNRINGGGVEDLAIRLAKKASSNGARAFGAWTGQEAYPTQL